MLIYLFFFPWCKGLDVLEYHFTVLFQTLLTRTMSSFNFFRSLLTLFFQVFFGCPFSFLSSQLNRLLHPWIVFDVHIHRFFGSQQHSYNNTRLILSVGMTPHIHLIREERHDYFVPMMLFYAMKIFPQLACFPSLPKTSSVVSVLGH